MDRNKINLTYEEINKVVVACNGHTSIKHVQDLDIGTCWDSDRLDLYRVGIYPEVEYLNNKYSKKKDVINAASDRAYEKEMSDWAF